MGISDLAARGPKRMALWSLFLLSGILTCIMSLVYSYHRAVSRTANASPDAAADDTVQVGYTAVDLFLVRDPDTMADVCFQCIE